MASKTDDLVGKLTQATIKKTTPRKTPLTAARKTGLPTQAGYGTDWEKRYFYNPAQVGGRLPSSAWPAPSKYYAGYNTTYLTDLGNRQFPLQTGSSYPWVNNYTPYRAPLAGIAGGQGGSSSEDSGGGYYGGGYYGGGGGYYGGYDTGGGEPQAPAEPTWSDFDSGVTTAPTWWKARKPSVMNDETEYMSTLNMMIPFLSPEDQKTVASTLYTMDAKNFGHLNPEKIEVKPETEITTGLQRSYTSTQRAQNALSALTKLAGAVGKKDEELGAGYRYLRSILDTANRFGAKSPTEGQTRRQYQQMMAALDPLLASSSGTSGTLSPYGSLVKMLSTPFFSGGQLRPMQKTAAGEYIFGLPNKGLL